MRVCLATLLLFAPLWAQSPEPYKLTEPERGMIEQRAAALAVALERLDADAVSGDLRADVAIYHKALRWALRYPEEFYRRGYVHDALNLAAEGAERIEALAGGEHPWTIRSGTVARGYRSRVDGSVQPYRMYVPAGYDGSRPMRLDVVLHGRNSRLSEVSFLAGATRASAPERGPGHLVLEVFGRTNNAYRWAGETDVFEALAAARRNYRIDSDRIVLRGFSMGGAGAWHLGLHHPDRWVAVEAGAGFTDTLEYAKGSLPQGMAGPWQRKTLHIYDAVDYATNAHNVAVVGYGGEDDKQLQASVNIRRALEVDGAQFRRTGLDWWTKSMRALFLVGPKTGHRFHPASKALSNAYIDEAVKKGRRTPTELRFMTYTTRYADCHWLTVDGMERSYERAEVEADRDRSTIDIRTENVTRLVLRGTETIERIKVDGVELKAPQPSPTTLFVGRQNGSWRLFRDVASMRGAELVKRPGLQGPIDDALTGPFLVVRPSGESPNAESAEAAGERFRQLHREFPKWMRGDPPTVGDGDLSAAEIAGKNLLLFGDPFSNSLLGRLIDRLPVRWTRESIEIAGRRFDAAKHVLAMIYPNPLNPERYVVLNSGHSFGEVEFRGTNALLFPRLGDWAVLTLDGEIAAAGLFDERWRPVPDAN